MSDRTASAVFFLSDYGLDDELVGVVHAVLRRGAPGLAVVDLTHRVAAFDVRAGAAALWRAAPHLGPGVVLAVVDPGVGTDRRSVALEVDGAGPRFWVGPDNGLLLPAAEAVGALVGAVGVPRGIGAVGVPGATTFDGRDVLAPAAAALALGRPLAELGPPLAPSDMVRLPAMEVTEAEVGGRHVLRAEVSWIDRFGNVQLAAGADRLPAGIGTVALRLPEPRPPGPGNGPPGNGPPGSGPPGSGPPGNGPPGSGAARRTASFSGLADGEVGVLADANGRLALVLRQASAAAALGLREGDVVELSWT